MCGMRRRVLVLLLPVLLLLMAARQAPLVNPDPIAVPKGLSSELVAKDIKRALITRGWVVSGEQTGQIDATLHLRAHSARIAIQFDGEQVRLRYVDSENLKFEESKKGPLIHKNYLAWVANLCKDISANLQLSALG